jgi:hypothetical protein
MGENIMNYKLELSDTFRATNYNECDYGATGTIIINEISESAKLLCKYIMKIEGNNWKTFINDEGIIFNIRKYYNIVNIRLIDNNLKYKYRNTCVYSLCIKDDTYLTSSTKIQLEIPSSITDALLWENI